MALDSHSPIVLRRAGPEDVAEISELGSHVFAITSGPSVPPNDLQAYLSEFYSTTATAKDILDPSKSMIAATDGNGAIVGFALLTRGTSEPCIVHLESKVEVQRVYIHPRYHGRGIGKLLLNEVEATAMKEGFRNIWLGVWEENDKAQKVYEKSGYKIVGGRDFAIGKVVQTDHIMVKEV